MTKQMKNNETLIHTKYMLEWLTSYFEKKQNFCILCNCAVYERYDSTWRGWFDMS